MVTSTSPATAPHSRVIDEIRARLGAIHVTMEPMTKIPRTANGKLIRRSLAALYQRPKP